MFTPTPLHKTTRRNFLAATAAVLCLAATATAFGTTATTTAKPLAGVKHVVLVGFDGLGAYAWEKSDNPNMKTFAARGALSLKTRSILPSISAPNWASHLMGAGPELHGYTSNARIPAPPSQVVNENGMFPNIFWLTRKSYPDATTAVLYEWGTIHDLIDYKTVSYEKNFPKKTPKDVPHKKLSPEQKKVAGSEENLESVAVAAAAYIKANKPLFTFICFDAIDATGHIIGHDTPSYYATVKKADAAFGKILSAIKEAGMEDSTVIILISDHGGINKGHGGKTLLEMQTPWVIAGPGIKRGHSIDSAVAHYDTAPTIAHILGLTPPQVWRGRPVLEAFTE